MYNAARCRGVLLCGVPFLLAGLGYAQQPPEEGAIVLSEGSATGSGPRARQLAHEDALEHALYLWVDTTVGGLNREQLKPLFGLKERYIQTSRLLEQRSGEDGLEVEAEVYLNVEALRFDLARLVFPLLDYTPRVLILVEEQRLGEKRPTIRADGIAFQQIAKVFQDQGFEISDLEELSREYETTELQGLLGEGVKSMSKLAREVSADITVFGSAAVQAVPQEGLSFNFTRLRAEVELRAVGAQDGYVCEWLKSEAELNTADPASGTVFVLQDGAYKIQRHMLVASILTAFTQERWSGIVLTVDDVPGYNWANRIRRAVIRIEGVRRTELLRARSGKAVLALDYEGHVARLVESLKALPLQTRRLRLTQALTDDLRFTLVRADDDALRP